MAVWIASALLDSSDEVKPMAPVQPRPEQVDARMFYERSVRSAWILWDSSPEELREHGRRRAEREYEAGWSEIEVFGPRFWREYVDRGTGLYFRNRGCVIMNGADVEARAHNERLRELVAAGGPPADARSISDRFKQVLEFSTAKPELRWVRLPVPEDPKQGVTVAVGPLAVNVELDDGEQSEQWLSLTIKSESGNVVGMRSRVWPGLHSAFWSDPRILILRWQAGKSDDACYTFYDVVHGRDVHLGLPTPDPVESVYDYMLMRRGE
jgi:hypothetical protein